MNGRSGSISLLAFLFVVLVVPAWLFGAWLIMIVVGVMHHDWWPLIPPMRYGTALILESLFFLAAAIRAALEAIGSDR